jgi:hypothetical protein
MRSRSDVTPSSSAHALAHTELTLVRFLCDAVASFLHQAVTHMPAPIYSLQMQSAKSHIPNIGSVEPSL